MENAAAPRALTAPVVLRRLVTIDPQTGGPVVTTAPYIPKAKIQTLALQALSLPYTSPEDELAIELGLQPSDFYGRPLVEVMVLKAALGAARTGDIDMIEKVLDRAIGRPKTSSENLNLNGSYEDFLKAAAALMSPAPNGAAPEPYVEVTDAEPASAWETLA